MTVAPVAQGRSDRRWWRRPLRAVAAGLGAAVAGLPWTPLWIGDLLASFAPALALGAGLGVALALLVRRFGAGGALAIVALSAGVLTATAPRAPAGAGNGAKEAITLLVVNARMTPADQFLRFMGAVDADIVAIVEAPWELYRTAVPEKFAFRHWEGPRSGGPAVRALYSRWPGRLASADLPDRSVFGATIEHPDGPIGVVVLQALSPRTLERWREGNRRTREAARLATELEASGAPALIAGDFNSAPTGRRSRLLGSAGFGRAHPLRAGGSFPAGLWGPMRLAIDGAALGPGFAVRSWRTLKVPGSDHRAVLIELARLDQ